MMRRIIFKNAINDQVIEDRPVDITTLLMIPQKDETVTIFEEQYVVMKRHFDLDKGNIIVSIKQDRFY